MKYSEMNERQKRAYMNIKYAAQWRIGELENILMDYEDTSEEYAYAELCLSDHQALVEEIYNSALSHVYTGDSEYFGPQAEMILRDIRLCGKEWLMERVDRRVTKEGY